MRITEEKFYEKCKRCNGEGYTMTKKGRDKICEFCQGTGKLTWLENVFGKKYGT